MYDRQPPDSGDSQIDDVLNAMHREASDSTDLGRRFERLCTGVLGALRNADGRRVFDRVDA